MVLVVVPILCVLLVAVLVYMLYRKWQKRNRRKKYGGAVRMNEILHQQNEEQVRINSDNAFYTNKHMDIDLV